MLVSILTKQGIALNKISETGKANEERNLQIKY